MCEVTADHVESAEHPASSALLLVHDALRLGLHAEVSVELSCIGEVLCQVVDVVGCDGVEDSLVCRTLRL